MCVLYVYVKKKQPLFLQTVAWMLSAILGNTVTVVVKNQEHEN